MKVQWATQSAQRSDDLANTSERLVNCYPEPAAEGSKAGVTIRSVLGLESLYAPSSLVGRAMASVNGDFYVAASGALRKVTSAGVPSVLGTINDDPNTFISSNGANVTVAAGGTYYVWNGSTLTTPGGGRITDVGSVEFHDGYTLLTDRVSGEFEWTELGTPATRNALNFADAESSDDKLRRVAINGREVWLFGERSSEVWRNTGLQGADAFARSAAVDRGILGATLTAKIAEVQVVVGDDGVVYEIAGFRFGPISTPPVENAIADSTPTHVCAYEERGRKFAVVRFSDRPAWVFDLSARRWHERASTVYLAAWEIIATARLGKVWYGLNGDGTLYRLVRSNMDGAEPLARILQTRPFDFERETFSVDELELLAEVGTSDLGRAARVALQVSRDGGVTWEPEMWRSLGSLGQYRKMVQWHALGAADEMAFRFTVTDPADINLYSQGKVEVSV